jgi:hypothetical protein
VSSPSLARLQLVLATDNWFTATCLHIDLCIHNRAALRTEKTHQQTHATAVQIPTLWKNVHRPYLFMPLYPAIWYGTL